MTGYKCNGYHNDGPIGERDYEDAGNRNLSPVADTIQAKIIAHQAYLARTSKARNDLRTKLYADFRAANGRRPTRPEEDRLDRQVNVAISAKFGNK